MDIIDHRRYTHNLNTKKEFQALTGYEPMTSAIPVQCSTKWAINAIELGAGNFGSS